MDKKISIPILYDAKEKCCGCSACYAACPKEAITMVIDEEGFKYPSIEKKKCVGCHMCVKVCPFK
ncbi:4Fe-4S dicluster domain-containing protein [uncultured Phascolarctobacterium sp.]|uniref:4Fe-4S dicluster domain-containing protein n=1 Tax=uncultured Phascolarctobacterium sp. TaxID=512296 RepID=UPI0025D960BF|nr:4Fe-4S dicluster domain-containing protein [uncultured Phascolarctobacterium sp.]